MAEANTRLETSRALLIQSAADLLEGIARAKALQQKFFPVARKPARGSQGGDLALDLMRLQVDYLSRLSELSHSHRDLAYRALDTLYKAVAPRTRRDQVEELLFDSDTWKTALVIENRVQAAPVTVALSCTPVAGASTLDLLSLGVTIQASAVKGKVEKDAPLVFQLEFGKPKTIHLEVKKGAPARRRSLRAGQYQAYLEIQMDRSTRRVLLSLQIDRSNA